MYHVHVVLNAYRPSLICGSAVHITGTPSYEQLFMELVFAVADRIKVQTGG